MSFYEFAFESRFWFPVPKLEREVFGHYEITPSQLMLNSWRILKTLDCLNMKSRVEFELDEVLYTYFFRENDKEKGYY